MDKQNKNQSNNNWQNLGICYIYAEEKIKNPTLRCIYMALARKSFGYGQIDTGSITQEEIANATGISIRTLRDKVKELESLGFVRIEGPNTYRGGGGSYACKYFPDFPSGYGYINTKKTKTVEEQTSTTGSVSEEKVSFSKGIDF